MSNLKPTDAPNVFTVNSKDIVDDSLSDDDRPCEVCAISDHGHKHLPNNPLCPHCGEEIIDSYQNQLAVIQEDNSKDEQEVFRAEVLKCSACNKYIAMVPTPIFYNANHDVFYTGGHSYLPVEQERKALSQAVKTLIEPLIKNWYDRIKGGELLDVWNLVYWLQGSCEKVVADFLAAAKKKGRSGSIRKQDFNPNGLPQA